MKQLLPYSIIVLLATVSVVSCKNGPSIPSLQETFAKKDTDPFGTAVAFEQVEQLYYSNDVRVKKTSLNTTLSNNFDTASLYINISKKFLLSADDRDSLLAFAGRGNAVFISSEETDSALLGTLGLPPQKLGIPNEDISNLGNTTIRLNTAYFNDVNTFSYYYLPLDKSFTLSENDYFKRILGTNALGAPNFLLLYHGRGRFYLHCEPRAFSNYFLLQKENFKYLQQAFTYTNAVPEHIFWDDYYNKRNSKPSGKNAQSGLEILLQDPAMAWAFWISLFLMLLYLLFGSKRRQRIVKPIMVNQNTSVAFTETVSRLYLEKKDNRNIAEKMIAYFFEYVRNTYFLNTSQINDDFISTLSRKSNTAASETERLMKKIQRIQQSYEKISDQQLLSLNAQIEKFHQHKI